jgi:uncharacterized protein (TIGR02246 family)
MFKPSTFLVVTLALIGRVVVSATEKCESITPSKVRGLWMTWNEALQTDVPENAADLYHPESVLLPTLSNQIRDDRESQIEYFEHFMQKKPVGYIQQDYVNIKTCNTAEYNGIYTFDLTAIGKKVNARFTYVYTYENDEWKIKTHHSSLMPEDIARRNLRASKNPSLALSGNLAPTKPVECAQVNEHFIKNLWNKWNAVLLTRSAEKVGELYWKIDSVLLPTLSNQVRIKEEEKENYFEHFLMKKPTAVINQDFVSIGCNEAQYNGIYTFTLTDPDTQVVSEAMARFTYVFTTYGGEWKIQTHHSSLMPNQGGLNGAMKLSAVASKDFVDLSVRRVYSTDTMGVEFSIFN